MVGGLSSAEADRLPPIRTTRREGWFYLRLDSLYQSLPGSPSSGNGSATGESKLAVRVVQEC